MKSFINHLKFCSVSALSTTVPRLALPFTATSQQPWPGITPREGLSLEGQGCQATLPLGSHDELPTQTNASKGNGDPEKIAIKFVFVFVLIQSSQMVVPFNDNDDPEKSSLTRGAKQKSPPMRETKCQWENKIETWAKWNIGKLRIPGTDLQEKKCCCSQWRVVSMQATSPFSDTRISIFQNISTSLPFHGSPTVPKNTWRFANLNPPPGRLQHHQGTGDAEIFILTRLHGMKPWPILLRSLSSDTTFASGRCISEMDPVWQDLFGLQHGFPHWEEMVFGGSQNLVFFFFANRNCFSTTQLDSI